MTMIRRRSALLLGVAAVLGTSPATFAAEPVAGPGYQIVLRSRSAEAVPNRVKDAQTGAGSIVVEQPEPHTIVVTMGGSAVAGSDFHGSSAGITFNLEQDLDIIPTRPGVRPPRVGMVGRVVGTLQVSNPGKCGRAGGSADQGPAVASLSVGENALLSVNVKSSAAACGHEVAVNHRDGPVESAAYAGSYRLTSSFRIATAQGQGVFNRQWAVADFDPAPQLDAFWGDALKPFRAVPRKEFGFRVVLRVVESQPE
jgi:hypothetical protein